MLLTRFYTLYCVFLTCFYALMLRVPYVFLGELIHGLEDVEGVCILRRFAPVVRYCVLSLWHESYVRDMSHM